MADVGISVALLDSLTLGDIEDVEELAGVGFSTFQDGAALPARAIRALAYVVLRRDDPSVTFEGCRNLSMNDLLGILKVAPSPLGKLEQPASSETRRAPG